MNPTEPRLRRGFSDVVRELHRVGFMYATLQNSFFILALLHGAGCAAGDASADVDDTGTADTDPRPDTADTGQAPNLEGDWLTLSGSLDLVGGQPQSSSSIALDVQVTDAEGTITLVDCLASLTSPGVAISQPADEVELYGLWRFEVDAGDCIGLPSAMDVGIGPLIPALWPAADQVGASRKHTRGLYTPNPRGAGLLVFGMAGTLEQINGEGTPVSLDPLPDGRYHLRSAYLLEL